jgi:MFS transporter, OFA family, oxalate/formate antiporter
MVACSGTGLTIGPVGATAARPVTSAAPTTRFYGWRVVAAAFTVLFVAYGLQFSFGVFVNEIIDDTGWSRADILLPYAVYVALYSWLSSVSGWATDRYGPRRVVAIGAVILGIGWAGFGLSHALWQVYLTLGVVAAVGMSATWVPCNATVVRWFVRRRGTAVGVASSGGATGNLVVPPVAAGLIAVVGWRATIPAMAVVGTVAMLACSRFMVRDPEELGLHPDGDALPPVATATSLADEDSFTAAEARRTGTFWCVFALFALTWIAVFVPFAHLAAFAEDLGDSALAASLLLSAIGLGGVAGRLTIGPLSDRVGRRPTLAFLLALQVVAFSGFAAAHGLWMLFPAAALFGAAYGGSTTILPALVGDQFGRRAAGAIVGQIFAGAGAMAAIGPYVAAAIYDATASYRMAFLLSGASNVVALLLVGLLRPPRRPLDVVAA